MNDRVLAIVVTYNPQLDALGVALRAVIEQVAATLVIDNASSKISEIRELCSQLGSGSSGSTASAVSIKEMSENVGLGAAHNLGFDYARQHGFSHCLILDQDSVPLSDMVKNLHVASVTKSAVHGNKLSAVGATYLNADNGSESFFIKFGWTKFQRHYCASRDKDACIEADFLISSGTLIELSTLDEIGGMDEQLFIDHVDTEWFLRAKSKGYHAYGVCNAVMQHGLGEQTHRVSLAGTFRQRNVPQHKPFRYYYIFRNSVLLYRRSYAHGWWKWNDFQRLIMIAVMFGMFKRPRWENLKMMGNGVLDGMRGVTGPLSRD